MPSAAREWNAPRLAAVAVLVLAGVAVLALSGDHGVTWDEGVQRRYGELALDYFRSGGEDRRADEFLDLRFYGPAFEAALVMLEGEGDLAARFDRRHRANALFGLLALPALFALAASARRPWLAALAGVALLAQPRFFGHLFANTKDVPFAAGLALAVAAFAGLASRDERSWGRVALCGLALGLVAALRPGGWPVGALLLALAFAANGARALARGDSPGGLAAALAGQGLLALAISWVVMVLPWPWAHEAPFANPLAAMFRSASFEQAYDVLYRGRVLSSDALPRAYPLVFVAIATPPLVSLLAVVGTGFAVARAARSPREGPPWVGALVAAWAWLPFALFALVRPNTYDGLRHVLFVLPALAWLAALALVELVALVPAGGARRAAAALAVLALLLPLPATARLHPYAASYFNFAVGGVGGADGRYETDYWASSYREGMAWIREREAGRPPGRKVRVLVAANAWSITAAAAYAGDWAEVEPFFQRRSPLRLPAEWDYYLATYRYGLSERFPGTPVLHTIGRDGATFALVRGERRLDEAGP